MMKLIMNQKVFNFFYCKQCRVEVTAIQNARGETYIQIHILVSDLISCLRRNFMPRIDYNKVIVTVNKKSHCLLHCIYYDIEVNARRKLKQKQMVAIYFLSPIELIVTG